MKKKILFGLLAIIIIIQFFRIDKTNPEISKADDFVEINNPPEEITAILKSSCYDCHSNETKYPWYSNIAPVSWWVKDHINEGRDELNFSEWGTFKEKRKDHKLEECVEMLEEGEMPLDEYTWTHSEAKLTTDQKTQLINWFKEIRELAKAEKNEPVLSLNNGKRWIANTETTEGIERMRTIIIEDVDEGRISHYVAMGQRLNIEMKTVFEKCTMKGEAHEQLHTYLLPMVKKFRYLEEVEEESDALIMQKDILTDLNNYANFFETVE
jgi:Haem-binding domain